MSLSRDIVVASWNVNSVMARLERVQAFLERVSPDVLCLQELKCDEAKFPFAAFADLGYEAVIAGQKTYNGVAILSRLPLSDARVGFGDGEDDPEARFVTATVAGVRVMSAYVPNGQSVGSSKFQYKLAWLSRLRDYLDRHHAPDEALILAGDFNVAPEERDVHDPAAWEGQILFSAPEREALSRVHSFGLVDTFRLFEQGEGRYSWWDYRNLSFPKNRGLRIDFIFASKALAKSCSKAWIDRDERKGAKPSDHAPCLAVFSP